MKGQLPSGNNEEEAVITSSLCQVTGKDNRFQVHNNNNNLVASISLVTRNFAYLFAFVNYHITDIKIKIKMNYSLIMA